MGTVTGYPLRGAIVPSDSVIARDVIYQDGLGVISMEIGAGSGGSSPPPPPPLEAPSNVSPPSIVGSALIGATVIALAGTWDGSPNPTISYQWQADGADIPGANGTSLLLTDAYVGKVIGVVVTATNSQGSASEVAVMGSAVAAAPPVNTFAPSISGQARVGETLTANPGTWTGSPAPTFAYQWKADASNIVGATSSTYELTTAEYDKVITVEVTATNVGGSASAVSSATSKVQGTPPVATVPPSISGNPGVGETLTASAGTWAGYPSPSYAYQWRRNGEDIPGETGGTYDVQAQDFGSTITVRVLATNPAGSAISTSAGLQITDGIAPANTTPPSITGTPEAGKVLTVTAGTWVGVPTPTLAYQWKADGADIPGATASTLLLSDNEIGKTITVTVTATNSEGSASATSSGVGPVAGAGNEAPANIAPPTISGVAAVGQTLTASPGSWSGVPTPTYAYQWKRNGVAISGATNPTYVVQEADFGYVLTVEVTATNSEGSAVATSSGTQAVVSAAPLNTVPPSISGTPAEGETLTCNPGTWVGNPSPTFSYQWKVGGAIPADGGVGPTYIVRWHDYQEMITCEVTATNAHGSKTVATAPVGPADGMAPQNYIAPTISGTPNVGNTLTCNRGSWFGTPDPTYAYQWRRDGVNISGATNQNYTVQSADAGKQLTCRIVATNIYGTSDVTTDPVSVPGGSGGGDGGGGSPGSGGTFLRPFSDSGFANMEVAPTATYADNDYLQSFFRSRTLSNPTVTSTPGQINTSGSWNCPIYQAKTTDPWRTIRCATRWDNNYGPVDYTYEVTIRMPADAMPSPDTDGPLVIFDADGQRIHEFGMGASGTSYNPWRAGTYTCWDINAPGEGGTEYGDTRVKDGVGVIAMSLPGVSGRASGLPMCLGILRAAHFQAGLIPHTVCMTMAGGDMHSPWTWPATRDDYPHAYPNQNGNPRGYVRCGEFFAIPWSVNLDALAASNGWAPATLTLAKACQRFGVVIVDRAGYTSFLIDGSTPMATWNSILTSTVKNQIMYQVVPLFRHVTNHSQSTPKGWV